MSGKLEKLNERVEQVGGLRRLHSKASGVLGVLLAAAVFYLVYSGLDIAFKFSMPARTVSFVLVAAGVALVAHRMLIRPLMERLAAAQVAGEIERTYPEIEEALSTSIEYGTDPAKAKELSSPALVEALVSDTHDRTKTLPFDRAVDWRVTKSLAGGAAVAAVLTAVCMTGWPHLFGKTLLRLINPFSDIDPPTFTVIDVLTPRDAEIARGESVEIKLKASASVPETATVTIRSGEGDERLEEMIRSGGRGEFAYTLSRIMKGLTYAVAAGDARSHEYRITVYEEPRVLDISLRLEYPEYTGLEPREISDGLGEVTALRGTKVTVKARLNKPVESGALVMGSEEIDGKLAAGEEPSLSAGFTVERDDTYAVRLVDERGRENSDSPRYRVTALPDRAPKVRIIRPDKEVMAFRNQPVELEVEADDDYGVKEMGIYHTLGGEEKRLVIKKFGGAGERDATEIHPLHLALKGFKGGEIIQYYAYARDNDTIDGPKEALGELHFIRTYDEESYAPGPMQKRKKVPEAAKKVEDLIKRQMEALKKTFELARDERAAETPEPGKAPDEAVADEIARKAKAFGEEQSGIKKDLDDLLAEVEKNLPDQMTEGEEIPLEMEELRSASKKMGRAVDELEVPKARDAASREAEALRHLSEAQRLILSEFADESFRAAMENSARKSRKNRRKREQKEAEELEKQMAKLPPMLEREEEAERELDRLEDEEKKGPGTPEEQDERRKLKRKLAEEQKQLAQQAQKSSRDLQRMEKQNSETKSASKAMQQAAQAMQQTSQAAEKGKTDEAKRSAKEAQRQLERAQRELDRSLERKMDDRIEAAKSDAEDLAAEEKALADEAKKADQAAGEAKASGDPKKQEEGAKAQERAAEDLAAKQGGLREDAKDLAKELAKLAQSAASQPPEVRTPLNQANARAAAGEAQPRMQAAEEELKKQQMAKGSKQAEAAAEELGEIARDLQQALEAARTKEAERLAAAIEKARDIAERENQVASKAARGQMDEKTAAEQAELRKGAEELAEAAPNLKAVREAGKDTEVRRSFAKAGSKMRATERDMAAKDAKAAERDAMEATAQARKGLDALEAAAQKDLETELGKLLETIRDAKESQKRVDKVLANAGERAEKGKPVTEAEARRAAADEDRAAERTGDFAERLESAAKRLASSRPRDDLPKELGGLADRLERTKLPERMERLGRDLAGKPEALEAKESAKAMAKEEKSLLREVDAAARRLESLLAEASDEELRRLRTAEAEARELSKELAQLDEGVKAMNAEPTEAKAKSPGKTPGKEPVKAPDAKGLRDRADGIDDDLAFMQRRLKDMKLGEEDLRRVERSRETVKEVRRALSRNQNPRPSNRLADASGDFQVIGDELMRRIEEVLRKRKITEPADETAPEEYRRLVEKYYRALSED